MKKNDRIEIRSIQADFSFDEGRKISGLAIPVNSQSELLYRNGKKFYETISPLAINDNLINSQDIKVYLNHDESQGTFARSKYGEGSLHLSITERGLEFEFEAPNTSFGEALLEGIRRGDYDAISFCFIPDEKSELVTFNEDGTLNRTINNILWLDEISILSCTPAYSATDVNIRSIDNVIEERNQEILTNLDSKLAEINSL